MRDNYLIFTPLLYYWETCLVTVISNDHRESRNLTLSSVETLRLCCALLRQAQDRLLRVTDDRLSTANCLQDDHGHPRQYSIVRLEYLVFHNNDCPLGFRDFQKIEQVLDQRSIWNLNLNSL